MTLRDEDLVDEADNPILPSGLKWVEAKVRILVPRNAEEGAPPMTAEGWLRYYLERELDLRALVLGPMLDVTVCERGHVMPADEVTRIVIPPDHEEGYPGEEGEACADCADEAVAEAERRAER